MLKAVNGQPVRFTKKKKLHPGRMIESVDLSVQYSIKNIFLEHELL